MFGKVVKGQIDGHVHDCKNIRYIPVHHTLP